MAQNGIESEEEYNTEDEIENINCGSKNKKRIRRGNNRFNVEWVKQHPWLVQMVGKENSVKCTHCNCEISIAQSGIRDIKTHMKTKKHLANLKINATSNRLTSFFSTSNSSSISSSKKIIAAEAAFVYHTIKHAHSLNSANCTSALFHTLFPDSVIASNFSCARTKCSKIVSNVLAKDCQNSIISEIKTNNIPFSIATDSSNKGNIKMFPLVLRYFIKEIGVQTKILNFFDSPSETSRDIAHNLICRLEKAGLDPQMIISYSADNASVNFGSHQSVFTELAKINPKLLHGRCLCHMLANSIKKASNCLKFDIEYIIVKIYNEFSCHTKRKHTLIEFYQFCDVEYSEMLRHVSTRWLSLIPAIDRLYKNFQPIKSYFNSKSGSTAVLLNFLNCELAEAYLGLVSNIGACIQNIILKLEQDGPVVIEMYDLLLNLKKKLNESLKEQFFGAIAKQILSKCDNNTEKELFIKRASAFIEEIVKYIEKRFDFNNNRYEALRFFKLEKIPVFEELLNVINLFPIENVNIDALFEEFIYMKEMITDLQMLAYEEKWKIILTSKKCSNMEKIVQFIFALPHSNAMCERFFSLLFHAWRAERSRLTLKNVESEILVKHNYKMTCKEFYNYVLQNEELLKKLKSSEKYD